MSQIAKPTSSSPPLESLASALEQLLRAQLDHYTALLECITHKREAIRTANIGEVTSICGRENVLIQRVAEVERQRLGLIERMTVQIRPEASRALSISEIASALKSPQRDRVVVLGSQLREAVAQVRHQSSIVRAAAETLSRHMGGVLQTVHSAISRARVYGQRGSITFGASVQSMVDIKS